MRRSVAAINSLEILSAFQIARGRVTAVEADGTLIVEDEATESCLPCDFLRTSGGPNPVIQRGDPVLYICHSPFVRGCVIGIVAKYSLDQADNHVTLVARERLELRCGSSAMIMTKDGSVVVKGEQVVSRASGVNKIKGAAVKIN